MPRSPFLLTLLGCGQLTLSFISPHPKAVAHRQPKSYIQYYRGDGHHHGFTNIDGRDGFLHQVGTLRGGDSSNKNNFDYGSLSTLSVTELKRLLDDRGVDYRDCLEKRDLVERVLTSRGHRSGESASGSLSTEENRVVNTFARASPSVAYIQTMSQQPLIQRGFSLKGTEVPTGAGSGFLWDDKVSCCVSLLVLCTCTVSSVMFIKIIITLHSIYNRVIL